MTSVVQKWFRKRYGSPTPAQAEAWPLIAAGENVLIASPTGTGKTLAAFLSVLDQLAKAERSLPNSVLCLYISPLRALAYDLEKNLQDPLREIYGSLEDAPIRVGMRTGDTTSATRARQKTKPPHILLTTPESICIMLSQPSWLPILQSVRWVIVDEIHSLAEGKRGVHLTLSMERLAEFAKFQRIGLSATVAPMDEVGKFLVGTHGQCALVDATAAKKIHLRVHTPLRKDPYPEGGYSGQRLIRELGQLIRDHRTTLVFTNTRSGAEASTFWLRETCPDLAGVIECHHASLDRDLRQEVEDRLKRGELRAVVCSTSLELGIDIGSVDLVVMLATPKGVSRALQRTGRAGHNIHTISRGILMATNLNDLVEACATALLARTRHLDPVKIPAAPLDILAQHLVSMGCERYWLRDEALALVRSAWPYRELTRQDFDATLDYLAGGGQSLRLQYAEVFGKIELDDEGFQTRPGRVQREFLQNIGVIPETGVVQVRLKNRLLGSVEESFMRLMNPGDVFIISGRPVRVERTGQMEVFVTRADGSLPTIPRWNAHKMPLSAGVAGEIANFRGEVRQRLEKAGGDLDKWIAKRLDCGLANARIIAEMFTAQHTLSEIPHTGTLFAARRGVARGKRTPLFLPLAHWPRLQRRPRPRGRPPPQRPPRRQCHQHAARLRLRAHRLGAPVRRRRGAARNPLPGRLSRGFHRGAGALRDAQVPLPQRRPDRPHGLSQLLLHAQTAAQTPVVHGGHLQRPAKIRARPRAAPHRPAGLRAGRLSRRSRRPRLPGKRLAPSPAPGGPRAAALLRHVRHPHQGGVARRRSRGDDGTSLPPLVE